MTQALYAHMNNKTIKKIIIKLEKKKKKNTETNSGFSNLKVTDDLDKSSFCGGQNNGRD
jgi:hypothetical protein